jgi:nicotinamidase-related amidase
VTTLLLVVDVQNDYFVGGAHPLVGPDAAAAVVGRALNTFRAAGQPVLFVRHQWNDADAPYLRAGSFGGEIHNSVRPTAGEPVVDKEFPNAFLGTDLTDRIAASGLERLVVVGMMTNMCIDATVREAVDRELDTVLVEDGCAASDLTWGDRTVDGATVHTAFVAALADAGATVVTGDDLKALLAN